MLNRFEEFSMMGCRTSVSCKLIISCVLICIAVVGLGGCGGKEKNAGQSLVRANGVEITMLQLNDELKQANVTAEQQQAAQGPILESLINRQLLIAEAINNKIDRSAEVMQAIERSKAQIISQAYLQSIMAKVAKPSLPEIDEYYRKHPELFADNKRYEMKSLAISSKVLADKTVSDGLKAVMGSAKTLEEVEAWLKSHDVQSTRGQTSLSSLELPANMVTKLQDMPQGKLFSVIDGGRVLLVALANVKPIPIALKDAQPLIGQNLFNKKIKEVVDAEVASLRSRAKIEYINASAPVATTTVAASAVAAVSASAVAPTEVKPADKALTSPEPKTPEAQTKATPEGSRK
jgi:EpsD family peptidyl-prolyl cis-trans isomerase